MGTALPSDSPFHFLYRPKQEVDRTRLSQGDLLARTPECVETISQAHQYYSQSPNYTHFAVITQSCDLVRRSGGNFSAPYITIAAAKPLRVVIGDLLPRVKSIAKTNLTYRTPSDLKKGRQLIERYLNNTENHFFFLPESSEHGVAEDLVVYLHLSIALRPEHYDVLARSKIAEVHEIFQAKLGWLKGNIYSRVATPDLEEELTDGRAVKMRYYSKYLPDIELSGHQATLLAERAGQRSRELERDLTRDETIGLLQELPTDIEIVSQKLVDRLISANVLTKDKAVDAQKAIANSNVLKGIVSKE